MIARKQLTLAKLQVICGRIENLLAGQSASLADVVLPQDAKPGETTLEKLQRFKALLNKTLQDIAAGVLPDCQACGRRLSAAILDAMPWALNCERCGSGALAGENKPDEDSSPPAV